MILTIKELENIVNFAKENDLIAVSVYEAAEYHRHLTVCEVWGDKSKFIGDPKGHSELSEKYRGGYFSNKQDGYYICAKNKEKRYRIRRYKNADFVEFWP